MKKIKVYVFGLLLAMAVFAMTGCSNKDNNANNTTSAAGTQTTTQGVTTGAGESSGMGTNDNSGTNDTNSESSTGVIGGIVDDVERGVNDVVDGTSATTNTSDETTK